MLYAVASARSLFELHLVNDGGRSAIEYRNLANRPLAFLITGCFGTNFPFGQFVDLALESRRSINWPTLSVLGFLPNIHHPNATPSGLPPPVLPYNAYLTVVCFPVSGCPIVCTPSSCSRSDKGEQSNSTASGVVH